MGKKVHLVGFNILVEPKDGEEKTSGGILMPESRDEDKEGLGRGIVRNVGPGFLMPSHSSDSNDDISTIISGGKKDFEAAFIPLDVKEGDTVYFPKSAGDDVMLDGTIYVVVPYPAVKLFVREV